LVGGPPGIELHTVVEELPSGAVGEMFPIVVTTIGVGIVPNATAGAIAVGEIVGANAIIAAVVLGIDVVTAPGSIDGAATGTAVMEGDGRGGSAGGCGAGIIVPGKTVMADVSGCWVHVNGATAIGGSADVVGAVGIDGIAPVVPAVEEKDVTGTAGVPGVICPVGMAQVTTVPGIVGSEASGTGANVVSGTPGWVVAENGLGPLSGEVTIVPGVDESPMAVVPMVETCARLALQPNSRAAANKCRIAIASCASI
jgi:hypothetical protein